MFTLTSAFAESTPETNDKAKILRIVGAKSVKVTHKDQKTEEMTVNREVVVGDTVATNAESIAQLSFYDGSVLSIGKNSIFRLDKLRGDTRTIVHWTFTLLEGAIRGIVTEKETKKSDQERGIKMTIQTPIAALGVRGTQFTYTHTNTSTTKRTEIFTEHGNTLFSYSPDFPPQERVEVRDGEWSFLEEKIILPAKPLKYSENKGLKEVLDKYGLSSIERDPQSTSKPDLESMQNCIDRKLGWRYVPDQPVHVGECYP